MNAKKIYGVSLAGLMISMAGCNTSSMRAPIPENQIAEKIIPDLPSIEKLPRKLPVREATISALKSDPDVKPVVEPVIEPVVEPVTEVPSPSEPKVPEMKTKPPIRKQVSIERPKPSPSVPKPVQPAEKLVPDAKSKWPVDISAQYSEIIDGVPIIDNPNHCGNGDLEIGMTVENVGKSKGLIVADLHNDVPEDFLKWDKVVLRVFAPAVKGETKFCMPLTKPGAYAAVVYHDKNGNKSFDRNFLGIPKERFGATGNPKVRPRAPHYHEAAITVPEDGLNVRVRLHKASDIFGGKKE